MLQNFETRISLRCYFPINEDDEFPRLFHFKNRKQVLEHCLSFSEYTIFKVKEL